jgi:hypothetical protein
VDYMETSGEQLRPKWHQGQMAFAASRAGAQNKARTSPRRGRRAQMMDFTIMKPSDSTPRPPPRSAYRIKRACVCLYKAPGRAVSGRCVRGQRQLCGANMTLRGIKLCKFVVQLRIWNSFLWNHAPKWKILYAINDMRDIWMLWHYF